MFSRSWGSISVGWRANGSFADLATGCQNWVAAGQRLLLLVSIDAFFFPDVKSLGITWVDFHADCIDGEIKFFLNFNPVVLYVFWDSHDKGP